jgi:hypothetical protein
MKKFEEHGVLNSFSIVLERLGCLRVNISAHTAFVNCLAL